LKPEKTCKMFGGMLTIASGIAIITYKVWNVPQS